MLTSQSQNGQSEVPTTKDYNAAKMAQNRSSLLVLSSSKEDEDDHVYSLNTHYKGGVSVEAAMDPKNLI